MRTHSFSYILFDATTGRKVLRAIVGRAWDGCQSFACAEEQTPSRGSCHQR